jgi:hypothetical protein
LNKFQLICYILSNYNFPFIISTLY